MTSLLSGISGKFNVSLVLGTVLPATIFVIVARLLLPEVFPSAIVLPIAEDSEVFTLSLIVVLLSGVLHHLNTPHIRLYEGYPWKDTLIGKWRRQRFRSEFYYLAAQREGHAELRRRLTVATPTQPVFTSSELGKARKASRAAEKAARRKLNLNFPASSGSVLPTRLGNTIRSFESYPARMYGMAGVTLWPRLVAKIDPSYAKTMEGAKASLDFTLNSCSLSSALTMLLLGAGLVQPSSVFDGGSWRFRLLSVLILGLLAAWFYDQSVGRAAAWGNTVRSAFDLYRWELLSQLGYSRRPKTGEEEGDLWRGISWRTAYGYSPRAAYAPPAGEPVESTSAVAKNGTEVSLLRTVEGDRDDGRLTVVLTVRSVEEDKPAKEVTVRDTVPSGYDFVAGSQVPDDEKELVVVGSNPYFFHLQSEIAPASVRTLKYQIARRVRYQKAVSGGAS